MPDFNWVETGFDSPADPRPEKENQNQTWRFHLKHGQRANVVLLSDMNQFYHVRQHEVWINKSVTYLTCCQSDKVDCPLCQAAKTEKKLARAEYWMGTILNMDGYEKDGKVQGIGKRELFPLKFKSKMQLQEIFETCLDEGWPIKHGRFLISRSEDKMAPRIGDTFQAMPGFELEKWLKKQPEPLNVEPFNIMEMEEFVPSFDLCSKYASLAQGNTQDFTSQLDSP